MPKFDPHVLFTLLQRGWTILAGGITLVLIPYQFSPVEQGYYYTFASLIGMQVFFDLGFNSVIVQFVSHEYSHLRRNQDGRLIGEASHISRLASLSHLLRRWYRIAAALFFVCICPFGYLFFQSKGELDPQVWLGPWALQLLFTSFNLYFSPFLAVAEGQGEVGAVAQLRLRQSIIGYFIFWALIAVGAGLWVAPVLPAASAIGTAIWLRCRRESLNSFGNDIGADSPRISWYREIFPFQWRIALSWVSGYFIFSFFTPMVFRHQGPIQAGQVGMTLTIFSSLVVLGMSWVSAKVPNFSMLIARGQRSELNRLFRAVLWKSFLFTALSCAAVIMGICILRAYDFAPMKRIASLPVLLCLMAVTMTNILIFSAAAYMRAHKEEPMLMNSVTMGIAVLVAVWFCSQISVIATMASYAALVMLLGLPWTLRMFFRDYYRRTA
ncbi:MAG TPA: hypothetical protein VLA61_09180 [Ideonella sp.]|uniref:lipopolysaccharide biosynthesis protein n=1 Tax=Ideonella sp. TaxID=1929293 RepID=UPI002D1A940D|nr:hypothetical protein [Ideonella sp.]HSI48428.1 hypothetical protein [Ideonella sp.]